MALTSGFAGTKAGISTLFFLPVFFPAFFFCRFNCARCEDQHQRHQKKSFLRSSPHWNIFSIPVNFSSRFSNHWEILSNDWKFE